jgi:hypothetical protein
MMIFYHMVWKIIFILFFYLLVPDKIDGSNILDTGLCRQYNAFTFTHISNVNMYMAVVVL